MSENEMHCGERLPHFCTYDLYLEVYLDFDTFGNVLLLLLGDVYFGKSVDRNCRPELPG